MAEANVTTGPDTIVLIHGFWVTPKSWEHWKKHYEAKGYTVLAPAYPGFEVQVEVEAPRRSGRSRVGELRAAPAAV
jgi:esterase/lipase